MSKQYYGKQAIAKVEEMLGRPLTYPEMRVVEEEGYVDGEYLDTKGILTAGVGQTGKYKGKSFDYAFKDHEAQARKMIASYDDLPEALQAEIMSATYRGDLGGSPKFRKLFNEGLYFDAAKEFLDNDDYRQSLKEGTGIAGRMERVADAVRQYGMMQAAGEKEVSAAELQGDKSYLDKLFDSSIETVKNLFK